jgi:type II secretory pathway predicted ATPase ExeA
VPDSGGKRATTIYTIVEAAKLNSLNPASLRTCNKPKISESKTTNKHVPLSTLVANGRCGLTTLFAKLPRLFAIARQHKVLLTLSANGSLPTRLEKRERAPRELIKQRMKPLVLFIYEAHDLKREIIVELERLLETLFIFRKDRRCLHDLVAGTKVVKMTGP